MLLFCLSTSFIFSQNAAERLMTKGDGLVMGGYG